VNLFLLLYLNLQDDVVGTSLQQNGFNKKFYKNKICETMDNTYENLNIEMPKAQTV